MSRHKHLSQSIKEKAIIDPESAESALLKRRTFSIRMRIALSFLLCLVVIGGVTFTSYSTLNRIEAKLYFLDIANLYTAHIQQARRYEKNYLLYGTDLDSALDNLKEALHTLSSASNEIKKVVGLPNYQGIIKHLMLYQKLLTRLKANNAGPGASTKDRRSIEHELRVHGSQMVEAALRVSEAERTSVQRMLKVSKQTPVIALFILLALIIYITNFLTRQILRPIGRMVRATERIAQGDFSPLTPQKKYRDEFTTLALAFNRMLLELNHRQEMLAEAQKLRAIGTLTAGVAHELNNPINNISLTAEALIEDYAELPEKERLEMCSDLLSQADRAQGVVRNLLDFSRQREVDFSELDIGQLVRKTVKLIKNQIKLAKIKLETHFSSNLPPIQGDPQQLSQVFVNLCLNALDAMSRGGTLTITTAVTADDGQRIRVDISDTGAGIAPDVLPYIFDPFYSTKGAKGTGIGLAVSYGIVAKHGGEITVQSTPGKGTTFSIFLPVATKQKVGNSHQEMI